jgi:hypothetical protein
MLRGDVLALVFLARMVRRLANLSSLPLAPSIAIIFLCVYSHTELHLHALEQNASQIDVPLWRQGP